MKFEMVRPTKYYRNFNVPRDNPRPQLCIVSPMGRVLQSLTPAEISQSLHDVITGYLVNQDSIEIDALLYTLLKAKFRQLEWDLKYEKQNHLKSLKEIIGRIKRLGDL